MKARVITGLVGLGIAIAVLCFITSPLLGILIVPFAALAAFEIMHVAGVRSKPMLGLGIAVAAALPPLIEYDVLCRLHIPVSAALTCYMLLLFALMLVRHEETKFEHVPMTLLASLAVPCALSALTGTRDLLRLQEGAAFHQSLAIYFLYFTLSLAWITDTFAYFVGVKFGKHKLCPKISPKKTVEGALSGLLLTAGFNALFAFLFNTFWLDGFRLRIWVILLVSLFVSVISMLGDLTASLLKRNFGAKDFGKLFPGHGGVMDRFDSLLFVAPTLYILLLLSFTYHIPAFYMPL
ncbi:MAG: phosphatidate cytidylyltransferase [Oscillospiraceae bacterium]|jgi:phosphatidate cytidylyltransferase|nr:phosphatidate cytidylyltransferase [Oscillospiraceae bacterium]